MRNENGIQIAEWQKNFDCSQEHGVGSHINGTGADFTMGGIGRVAPVCAPFDVKVMSKNKNSPAGEVIYHSLEEVISPTGKFLQAIRCVHCDDTSFLRVGQIIRKGELMYYTGGTFYNRYDPKNIHLHVEFARGHTLVASMVYKPYLALCLKGGIPIEDAVYLASDCVVQRTQGYHMQYYAREELGDMKLKVLKKGMTLRKTANGAIIRSLKVNEEFDVLSIGNKWIKGSDGNLYQWCEVIGGFIQKDDAGRYIEITGMVNATPREDYEEVKETLYRKKGG